MWPSYSPRYILRGACGNIYIAFGKNRRWLIYENISNERKRATRMWENEWIHSIRIIKLRINETNTHTHKNTHAEIRFWWDLASIDMRRHIDTHTRILNAIIFFVATLKPNNCGYTAIRRRPLTVSNKQRCWYIAYTVKCRIESSPLHCRRMEKWKIITINNNLFDLHEKRSNKTRIIRIIKHQQPNCAQRYDISSFYAAHLQPAAV